MKKIEKNSLEIYTAGGCGKGLNFVSGALAGWGLAGYIVGGVAASTGVGLILVAGILISAYCS